MLAKERAKIWATDPHFDEKTRKTAAQMLENEEELLSAFGTELAFGTGGLRGVLGIGTNRMNEYTVGRATQGLADYLQERSGKSVAIGYDSRLRSREFAYFAAGVLARNGLTAHVYPRLMPTPMPTCKMGRGRVLPRIVTAMLPPWPSERPGCCCTVPQRSAAGDGSRGAYRPPDRP